MPEDLNVYNETTTVQDVETLKNKWRHHVALKIIYGIPRSKRVEGFLLFIGKGQAIIPAILYNRFIFL
jgi:hypothetical protein